jgi:hypothetical protein
MNKKVAGMRMDESQRLMREVLENHGVTIREVQGQTPNDKALIRFDLVGHHPRGELAIEVKHVRSGSIEEVLGHLALGVLQARQSTIAGHLMPLSLVVVRRLGNKTKQAVREFMAIAARDSGWGIVDLTGAICLSIPLWNVNVDEPGRESGSPWPRQRPARLFSDLNRWLLKILLLADSSPSLWAGPRQQVATPTELHRVGKVSVEKAHQFYRAFEQEGFLRHTRHGVEVVRRKALMEMWFHEERARRSTSVPTRWIFGDRPSLDESFHEQGSPGNFAVCGFEACRLLGVLHAPVIRREVYVSDDPESALTKWDLEPCSDRDAQLYLRRAFFPASTFRGRVTKSNIPVVDVLQAALDVCFDAARGREQAEYILEHVLGWKDSS